MKNHILFVDDERSILSSIKRAFRKTPLNILTTDSVEEALELIESKTISVLVSDYTMPGSTGADLLEKAKAIRPEMTRIILSGNGDQEATVESINRGAASRFLAKPWDDAQLINEITDAVSEWKKRVFLDTEKNLLNHTSFLEIVDGKISAKSAENYALAYFGFHDFERIQDRIGRVKIVEFMKHIVPASMNVDACVALGALDTHRYCALVSLSESCVDVESEVRELVDQFPLSTEFDDQKIKFSYDIGFVAVDSVNTTASSLLEKSITAYRHSCDLNGQTVIEYKACMDERKNSLNALENGLDAALSDNEFVLYYQPKINANDGSVHGAEALIRWNSKELGLVQPNDFIPIIERDKAIIDVGQWVLGEAAQQWMSWYGVLDENSTVSVNVSPKQLQDNTFIKRLETVLTETGIKASNLELEITESLMMEDIWKTISMLKDIKSLGVMLSIDDFGTGYSSLSHLSLMPVDLLKIDRSFISPMSESKESRNLVNNLIRMGHDLGVEIVAEGVEDENQLNILKEYGCDFIQGYYYSPPVPAEEFTKLVGQFEVSRVESELVGFRAAG